MHSGPSETTPPRRSKPVRRVRKADSPAVEPATARWHVWRGSPELLAHIVRVAERACGGTETEIRVAVADDQEVFTSPSDFVRDVTRDALRHFSSIAIDSRGPTMSISITFRWTGERPDSGDWDLFTGWFKSITWSGRDAEITVSAHGVDAAREREALKTVHNAIKRGGTDRFDQRRSPDRRSTSHSRRVHRGPSRLDLSRFELLEHGLGNLLRILPGSHPGPPECGRRSWCDGWAMGLPIARGGGTRRNPIVASCPMDRGNRRDNRRGSCDQDRHKRVARGNNLTLPPALVSS